MCMCQDAGMPGFTQQTPPILTHTPKRRCNQQLWRSYITSPSYHNAYIHMHIELLSVSFPSFLLPLSLPFVTTYVKTVCVCVCVFRGEKSLGDIKHGWRGVGRINKVLSRKAALQTLHTQCIGPGSTVFFKVLGLQRERNKEWERDRENKRGEGGEIEGWSEMLRVGPWHIKLTVSHRWAIV